VLIPFTVVRGAKEGPTLVASGGCHPTEYPGIDATIKLSATIRSEDLAGTFIGVPCVNIPGFWENTYINPIDGKNIQGLYPGKTDGTISDLIAHDFFNKIVLKANYFLDFHGADIHESEIWFAMYYGTEDETEKRSEALAKATGITYIENAGAPRGYLGYEAAKRGIPSALLEMVAHGGRFIPEESAATVEVAFNVMRHLRMLEGTPKKIRGQPWIKDDQPQEIWHSRASAYFEKEGLYHTDVKPGDMLREGQIVGTVTNWWGEVIETICAPAAGRVGNMVHCPISHPGNTAITVHY
jgi:hypothetical protein